MLKDNEISKGLSNVLTLNPALLVSGGLFAGIIPLARRGADFAGGVAAVDIALALAPVTLFWIVAVLRPAVLGGDRGTALRRAAKFAFFTALGFVLARGALEPGPGSLDVALPATDCGVDVEGRFIDARVGGKALSWLPSPGQALAKITRVRLISGGKWRRVDDIALVRIPKHASRSIYGEGFTGRGALGLPHGPLVPGGFDYRQHLLSKGVRRIFQASELELTGDSGMPLGVRLTRTALIFRDKCLSGLAEGLSNPNRKMLAALMFGCRQAVGRGTRMEYIRSGVAHIFAISGLHVGMLAAVLFLLFRWIPFRLRYWLVPFFLLVYVATTGWQPSAERAFLMISIWSINKGAFRRASALNAVALAAAAIMVCQPLSVLGAGFQYSFIIAGFLVLSWRSSSEWLAAGSVKFLFTPASATRLGYRFRLVVFRWMVNALSTSVVAWLAATGLNLVHGGIVVPGAVFANLLIVPLVWMLFVFAAVALPLSAVHFGIMSVLLNAVLSVISTVGGVGAETCGWTTLTAPSPLSLAFFFAALLGVVLARSGRTFFISATVLGACVATWVWHDMSRPGIVAVFHGGVSQEVSVVALPLGRTGGAIVVNAGSSRRTQAILEFMRLRGVDTVERVYFTRSVKGCCDGAWILFAGARTAEAVFPRGTGRSRYARTALCAAFRSGVATFVDDFTATFRGNRGLYVEKGSWRLAIQRPGWNVDLKVSASPLGTGSVQFSQRERCRKTLSLTNSSNLELDIIECER